MSSSENITAQGNDNTPEFTYHYTTYDTLIKICESQELHLSHANWMNDPDEIEHGAAAVVSFKKRIIDELFSENGRLVEHAALAVRTRRSALASRPTPEPEYFLFCLSTIDDDLNQWVRYGRGGGVCLKFNTRKLVSLLEDSIGKKVECGHVGKADIHHGKVKYSSTGDVKGEVESIFDRYIDPTITSQVSELCSSLNDLESRCAMIYKNSAYHAESEYRICARVGDWGSYPLRFRSERGSLIPFVALDFPFSAVASIMGGPSMDAKNRERWLRRFADLNGLGHAATHVTSLRYRHRD